MKVYLDTNILIDFVCKRVPFYEDAKRLFALGSIGQFDLVIKSLDSDWQDYEDSVQSMTAMDTFANCIITRNKKDFRKSVIPVYTIEELMSLM